MPYWSWESRSTGWAVPGTKRSILYPKERPFSLSISARSSALVSPAIFHLLLVHCPHFWVIYFRVVVCCCRWWQSQTRRHERECERRYQYGMPRVVNLHCFVVSSVVPILLHFSVLDIGVAISPPFAVWVASILRCSLCWSICCCPHHLHQFVFDVVSFVDPPNSSQCESGFQLFHCTWWFHGRTSIFPAPSCQFRCPCVCS